MIVKDRVTYCIIDEKDITAALYNKFVQGEQHVSLAYSYKYAIAIRDSEYAKRISRFRR